MEADAERSCEPSATESDAALAPENPNSEDTLMTESKTEIQLDSQQGPAKHNDVTKQDVETKTCCETEILINEDATGVQSDTKEEDKMETDATAAQELSTDLLENEREAVCSSKPHEHSEASGPIEQTDQEMLTTKEDVHEVSIPAQDTGSKSKQDQNQDQSKIEEDVYEASIPGNQDNHDDSTLSDQVADDVSIPSEHDKHDFSIPTEQGKDDVPIPTKPDKNEASTAVNLTHELSSSKELDKHEVSTTSQQHTHEISSPEEQGNQEPSTPIKEENLTHELSSSKEQDKHEVCATSQQHTHEISCPEEHGNQKSSTPTKEENLTHGLSSSTELDKHEVCAASQQRTHEISSPEEQGNQKSSTPTEEENLTHGLSSSTELDKHEVSTTSHQHTHEISSQEEQCNQKPSVPIEEENLTHRLPYSTELNKNEVSTTSQQHKHEISSPEEQGNQKPSTPIEEDKNDLCTMTHEVQQGVVKNMSDNVNMDGTTERRGSNQPTKGAENAVIEKYCDKNLASTTDGDCTMTDVDQEHDKVHCIITEEQNVGIKDSRVIEKSNPIISDSVYRTSEIEMKESKRGSPIEQTEHDKVTEQTQLTDEGGSHEGIVLEKYVDKHIDEQTASIPLSLNECQRTKDVPAETQVHFLDGSCDNKDINQEDGTVTKSHAQFEVGSGDASMTKSHSQSEVGSGDAASGDIVTKQITEEADFVDMETNISNIEGDISTDVPVEKVDKGLPGFPNSDDTLSKNNAIESEHDNQRDSTDEKKEEIEMEDQVPQNTEMKSQNSPEKPEDTGSPEQNVGTDIDMQQDTAIDTTPCQDDAAIQGMDIDGEEKTGNSDETNAGTSEEEKYAKTGLEKEEAALIANQKRRLSDDVASDSGGANSQGPADNVVKKAKKKTVNVWAKSSSRKGGKRSSKNGQQQNPNKEDSVLLTPVYVNPDKIEDGPDQQIVLSKYDKAEKIELSENRLTAGSTKGYRMVRATRGVQEGAWYFEIVVEHLGPTGHTRLGWSTQKGDVQAPVGFDANSYGYRDVDGSKVHVAMREAYGEPYCEGDVIGFYINLPNGSEYAPKSAPIVSYRGRPYIADTKEEQPKKVPESEICFFRNGVCQGTAFKDINAGRYFPAASMYTLPKEPNCTVRFNFGPEFKYPPIDLGERPQPTAMSFAPYHNGFSSKDARPISNSTLANSTQNSEFQIR